MASLGVMRMTDEQKKMLIEAKEGSIFCTAERMGQLFDGHVNVSRGNGVSGTVARTGAIYKDDVEALDSAESIVREVLGIEKEVSAPIPTPTPKPKARRKSSAKKKIEK